MIDWLIDWILPRDAVLSQNTLRLWPYVRLSGRLSVSLSVTSRCSIKTAKHKIKVRSTPVIMLSYIPAWSLVRLHQVKHIKIDPARGLCRLKSIKKPILVSRNFTKQFWMNSRMMLQVQQYLCPADSICSQLAHWRIAGANFCLIDAWLYSRYDPLAAILLTSKN